MKKKDLYGLKSVIDARIHQALNIKESLEKIRHTHDSFWQRIKDSLFFTHADNEYGTKKYIWGNALTLLYILGLLAVVLLFFLAPVESEMDIECTSGYVGLDVEANNHIQNRTIFTDDELLSDGSIAYGYWHQTFNETLLLDHINVNGIDDMHCKVHAKVRSPSYMLFNLFSR